MHQAQCGNAAFIGQVVVIRAYLIRQQQAFVNHGAAGHAGNVVFLAVLESQCLDIAARGFADNVEFAL